MSLSLLECGRGCRTRSDREEEAPLNHSTLNYRSLTRLLAHTGLDLVVQAKSGTGKTAAFATIALECLMRERAAADAGGGGGGEAIATVVLIVAPTRELAMQIHDVVADIGKTAVRYALQKKIRRRCWA